MFKKSLVALTVLSVCGSVVAAQANTTEFNQPDQSYVGKDISIYGSSITAKDITITTDKSSNGLTAYGKHTLNATGDISIIGKSNGIFTPVMNLQPKSASHQAVKCRLRELGPFTPKVLARSKEDVRNFGSKDIIGASNPGLYHDHENNQYQHETQIS